LPRTPNTAVWCFSVGPRLSQTSADNSTCAIVANVAGSGARSRTFPRTLCSDLGWREAERREHLEPLRFPMARMIVRGAGYWDCRRTHVGSDPRRWSDTATVRVPASHRGTLGDPGSDRPGRQREASQGIGSRTPTTGTGRHYRGSGVVVGYEYRQWRQTPTRRRRLRSTWLASGRAGTFEFHDPRRGGGCRVDQDIYLGHESGLAALDVGHVGPDPADVVADQCKDPLQVEPVGMIVRHRVPSRG